VNSGKAAAKKRPDGMPVGTLFQPRVSGNSEGQRSRHIRNILEGDVSKLPKAITRLDAERAEEIEDEKDES
jgi:hypothetical protein